MAMRYADTLSRPRALVPELDRLKEQVAYLKFWQGIVVVTDIAAGWFQRRIPQPLCVLHRQIERRIDQIGKL